MNQEDLKYVHPAAREAAGGARTALGSDYELQLRLEAGPAPAKLAKRKHQISSLYHHAKIRVSGLDMHLDLRCLDQLFVLTQHACAVLSLSVPSEPQELPFQWTLCLPQMHKEGSFAVQSRRKAISYISKKDAFSQTLLHRAGTGVAGTEGAGYQDKSRDTSKVWVVITLGSGAGQTFVWCI